MTDGARGFTARNEFGHVRVSLDEDANGPRILIEDLRNHRRIHLDPLELASLTWLTHGDLAPFLDPSQTGWRRFEPTEVHL